MFLHQTTTANVSTLSISLLFIILFLHQTTTRNEPDQIFARCLSSCSYIKPQQYKGLLNKCRSCLSSCSYIKPQPQAIQAASNARCLSSCSYIKPQQVKYCFYLQHSCLSSCSYIKPQLPMIIYIVRTVVYHLVPTSNHNSTLVPNLANQLFIILFLHQTTTKRIASLTNLGCLSSCSYIKPQLPTILVGTQLCCLSSCSYIKPQPGPLARLTHLRCLSSCSYIKPQPAASDPGTLQRCLSSCSYIKPQHGNHRTRNVPVVYHLVPTSNHNRAVQCCFKVAVVYHLVPTSNHNL